MRRIASGADMVIGAFTLHETGVSIEGRPSFGEFQGVLEFCRRAYNASGWWIADLLRYGDTRPDWKDRIAQVVDATGYSEKTIKNLTFIGHSVLPAQRRAGLTIAVHSEVASLTAPQQDAWLEKASTEGWSQRDLRMNIRARRRQQTIEGRATLSGKFRVIYADPAWPYGDRQPSGSSAEGHYPTMTMQQIAALPVAAHAEPDAVLFLWTTAPILLENPGPRDVIEAWGFAPKTGMVWDKVLHNFGHYCSVRHEHLIIATRGSCTPDRPTPMPDSVQTIRRGDVHSEKPEEFRRLIEGMYDGPYLELFGRRPVPGWTVFGNDAALWHQAPQPSALAQTV